MTTDIRLGRVLEVRGSSVRLEGFGWNNFFVEGEIVIGDDVFLAPSAWFGMRDKPMERLVIGDHTRIFSGQFASRNFVCGDYVTIHEGAWAYGRNDIVIGHNAWFGKRCTLDAEGGFKVGNGFGAGQDTHMWSHIRHGDVLAGSRFLSYGTFEADDDVWLVGRCTSAPAHHESRSMALAESNLSKGMPSNTIWGGNPAKDLTEKVGRPWVYRDIVERMDAFGDRVQMFLKQNSDVSQWDLEPIQETFDVGTRTYKKTNSPLEVRFMRFLLPEAKFVPEGHERITL